MSLRAAVTVAGWGTGRLPQAASRRTRRLAAKRRIEYVRFKEEVARV
jgi:hypothetical protein